MNNISDFFEWLMDCFKAIPSNVVTGLYTSLIFWMLGRIIRIVKGKNIKFRNLIERISSIWSSQPAISDKYTVIPSPQYEYEKRKENFLGGQYDNVLMAIFIVCLIIGARWLQNNYEKIQSVFYIFSGGFILLSTVLILMSTFTNRAQSSTLKYVVFSVLVSFYVGYSAFYLPELIGKMSEGTILYTKISWAGIYIFLGVLYVVVEIMFVIGLLLRATFIKIDSCKSTEITRKLVCKTNKLEKTGWLIFWFIMLTCVSYLLTSGILIDWIMELQSINIK